MPCCRTCCVRDSVNEKSIDDYEDSVVYVVSQPAPPADGSGAAAGNMTPASRVSHWQWNIAVYEDDDSQFTELLQAAELAIEEGVVPQRIIQGSSGSYFVKNSGNDNIGVFKPKDEEPYGQHNPKWGKWFQRYCCPCCFGRSCLIPNTGYLSEAAAYIVDQKLCLSIVPKTKVIRMASSTFHYGKIKRGTANAKTRLANKFPAVGRRFHRIGLPLKMGSFQVFVKGYKDAGCWVQQFESEPLPSDVAFEFQLEFERLVMLDYIIRNTDRGNDNWLIRYETVAHMRKGSQHADIEIALSPFALGSVNEKRKKRIKVAAIDNGLAFPFKHPDEIRAYPFQWTKLPFAKIPFSKATRDKFLPLLSNINVIEELCSDLYCLFSLDRNFKKHMFEKQMSVMRGQVLNLANALRDGKSPLQLAQMPNVRVLRSIDMPQEPPNHTSTSLKQTSSMPRTMKISPTNTLMFDDEYKPEFCHDAPLFTSW